MFSASELCPINTQQIETFSSLSTLSAQKIAKKCRLVYYLVQSISAQRKASGRSGVETLPIAFDMLRKQLSI